MNKIKVVPLFLFFVFLINSYAQPKFTVNLVGGYCLPLPDLKGDIKDSVDRDNTYITSSGFNGGITGKYALGKKGNFRVTALFFYNRFSSEDSFVHGDNVEIHNKINIITAGVGAEYAVLPKGKINPFIGLDVNGNFFSGEYEETVTEGAVIGDHEIGTETFKLHSAARFGLSAGAGLDFAFSKSFGAVVGLKYHLSNLIGKDYDSAAVIGEYNLNDKEYTVGTTSFSSKNISFMQFYAGLSIYIGQPKKLKK